MAETSLLAHPALVLVVAAAVVAAVPRRLASVVLLAAPLAAGWLVLAARGTTGANVELFGLVLTPLRADGLGAAFAGVFAVAAFLVNLYGLATTTRSERVAGLVTAGAAIGVALAGDLVSLLWWWELKAVATTAVVLAGGTDRSRRAGLRYLFVHLIGGTILLVGVAWHITTTGSVAFEAFALGAATLPIAVGFLVSAAAPPLHAWLPDAYPQATVAGSVLLSAFTTKAAVYALARGFGGVEALVWVGVAMALYGVVFAMLQDDLRGLLSYHIVSQVGFMVAAVGVGTAEAINGATAHAIAHIVYKALLLMGAGVVVHATGRTQATQLGGLARTLPWVLALYLVGAVSISGVPLFSGFVSKELSIYALEEAGRHNAVIALKIAAVGTLVSTLGKLPYATWIAAPARGLAIPVLRSPPRSMYVAMGIAAGTCVAIGVVPVLLWDQLPYPNTYTPLYLGKVTEAVQLLGVAALGFWLLRHRLAPHAGVVVDVDALYRVGSVRAMAALESHGRRDRGRAESTRDPGRRAWLAGTRTWLHGLPSLRPSWWLGAVLFCAALVLVIGSVS